MMIGTSADCWLDHCEPVTDYPGVLPTIIVVGLIIFGMYFTWKDK
jgi:hypothetical protein